jgi:SAM-dependent methyltransferase
MKDYFSSQSKAYAAYRPRYPESLFQFITGMVSEKDIAWDAGTGNGQTAAALAPLFHQVYATDISSQQLAQAAIAPNITYLNEPAEHTSIAAGSVNLVTVSQALHWFNFEHFYREVARVAAPGAIFAAWSYSLLSIGDGMDELTRHFHFETLKEFWDPERKYVDNGYSDLPFPFAKIESPDFEIKTRWSLQDLEGYLGTWSAVQKFIVINGENPVPHLVRNIARVWGKEETREVKFPIHLKMGYIH